MMNELRLKEELEKKKAEVAQLEWEIKQIENGRCEPELGDHYWYVTDKGDTESAVWEEDDKDKFRLEKRNVYSIFSTSEEVEFALEMYKFCKKRSFTPDWEDEEQEKYNFTLNHKERKICIVVTELFHAPGVAMWYPYEECVQEIINKYSFDELSKFYGRV